MRRTEKDTTYLGRMQREIVKITGTEPDYNYEYDLYRTMPELSGQLSYLAGRLQESADLLASISNETTSMENNFRQIIDQLHFFSEDVDRIPKALSDLDNAQSNLGTYISTIEKCPMAMDYLMLSSPDVTMDIATSNFLQRMAVTGENFLASFTKDYDSVGLIVDDSGAKNQETTVLNVWIARGTEWGEILKELNACLESLEDTSKDTPTDEKPSKDFLQTLQKADTQLEALVSYRFWARSKQKEEFEKIRVFHEDSRYLISLIKRLTEPPKRSNLSESTEQPKSLAAVLPLNRTQLKEIRNAYRNGLLFIIEFIENRE